jgi:hypothetical protein
MQNTANRADQGILNQQGHETTGANDATEKASAKLEKLLTFRNQGRWLDSVLVVSVGPWDSATERGAVR